MIDIDTLVPGWVARLVVMSATDDAAVSALETLWGKIRERNERIPAAIFEIGPGRGSLCTGVGWDQRYPVIRASLMRGDRNATAAEVLQELLHCAAHAIVYEPGKVAPTEGRYHDKSYRAAAESLGLDVEASDPVGGAADGWSITTLARGTLSRYRAEVDRLNRALARWEPTEQQKRQDPRQSRTQVMVQCSCTPPRKVRAGQKVLDKGGIRCEICGELFTASASS